MDALDYLEEAIARQTPVLGLYMLRYAVSSGWDMLSLTANLDCSPDALFIVAHCCPPRAGYLEPDADTIARAAGVDVSRLVALLKRMEDGGFLPEFRRFSTLEAASRCAGQLRHLDGSPSSTTGPSAEARTSGE